MDDDPSMDATELTRELFAPVPAIGTLGIEVISAVDGHAEVTTDVPPSLTNVIGSLHASGLAGLVDTCALAAVVSAAPDADLARRLSPLGRTAELQFLAPARGRLTARCELDPGTLQQVGELAASGKVRCRTETVVSDIDGTRVCTGGFDWTLRLVD